MREICNSEFKEQMKNLQEIPGVSERSALTVLAEIGPDVNAFPSAKHLVSWCGFNQRNDESTQENQIEQDYSREQIHQNCQCSMRMGCIKNERLLLL